jgi:hypothetical protein
VTTRKTAAKAKTPKAAVGAAGPASLDHASLTEALRALMQPLSALSVAHGMPFATVEEMLKKAFVDAARTAHSNAAAHRMVSRISTVTGLNRREVSRLTQAGSSAAPTRRSPATQVFTRWVAEPSLKTAKGRPLPLPRQGPAPSFEELARSVNRDVHPRSLLEELCRLGLVRIDGDTVHVVRESFVPKADTDRMLGFLGSNVGDHLRAAVANVLSDPPQHLEQAVFADELSRVSLDDFRQVVRTQWQALLQATVPLLHRLIEADQTAKRTQDQRVRIGMYMFSESMATPTGASDAKAPTRSRKRSAKPTRG